MKNYFIPEENFFKIIKDTFKDEKLLSIHKISTGWTNIVFEAKTDKNNYFFRFPRNDFWSKMIYKDQAFCEFIYGKLSFMTPNMTLHFNADRPFSKHTKIEGQTLTECMNDLTKEEIEKISLDVAKFINELSNLSIKGFPLKYKVSVVDFLNELANLHFSDINVFKYKLFRKYHTRTSVAHGDLNPGNILIKNKKIVGILDFCFAGYGHPYVDLSRMIGRSPKEYKDELIIAYEKETKTTVNRKLLDEFVSAWSNIDKSYTNYIKNNNPDIVLPDIL